MNKNLLCLVLAGWALFGVFSGCADTSQPDYSKLGLVEISGTVTMDNQPLPSVAVFFHDRANLRYSYGVTASDGRYTLMLDSRKAGVLPGEKEIEITSTKNPAASPVDASAESGSTETEGADSAEGEGESGGRSPEIVPAKYNTATTLKFTVTESNPAVDFSLSSK